jgi:hypothetical protein
LSDIGAVFCHIVRQRRAKIVTFEQYGPGASIAAWTGEMKASNRLQLSSRARATRLALLFGMVVVWSVVVLGLLPGEREISSAPRRLPTLPHSIPALPIRV